MKRISSLLFVVMVAFVLTGCSLVMRPFEEPIYRSIDTSEEAFLVPLEDDTGKQVSTSGDEFFRKHMVHVKRVRIPRRWVQTGRKWYVFGPHIGHWQPTMRLIRVDRAPVTVQFTGDRNGIWVESKDSIDFSTGISLTARIPEKDDAIIFLHNYPPHTSSDSLESQEDESQAQTESRLTEVLNHEVRARVQKIFAEQAASEDLNTLRDMKKEIIVAIETDVVPFFEARGIHITTVAQSGGFTYKDPKIQENINKVFNAQQDKDIAIAEAAAAMERKEALKLIGEGKAYQTIAEAEGKAESVRLAAQGEADAIQLVADAKAYEAEKLAASKEFYLANKAIEVQMEWLEAWKGDVPTMFMGDSSSSSLLLQVPTAKGGE